MIAEPEPEPEEIRVHKGTNYYVEQLSETDKRIFKLRYIGISYPEIARKIGILAKNKKTRSTNYIKERYWQIRQELKRMIENDTPCNSQ